MLGNAPGMAVAGMENNRDLTHARGPCVAASIRDASRNRITLFRIAAEEIEERLYSKQLLHAVFEHLVDRDDALGKTLRVVRGEERVEHVLVFLMP